MRSITVTADSAATPTYSGWMRLSHYKYDFNIGFIASPQKSATGTYSIQATEGNPDMFRNANYSRTTTTLTVTCVGSDTHGLAVGDAVNIQGTPWDNTGTQSLAVAGVSSGTVFTITVDDSGPAGGGLTYAPLPVAVLNGYAAVTGTQQGTITGAVQMVRVIKDSGDTLSGKVNLTITESGF